MAGREGLTVLFTLLGALLLGAGAQETKLTVLKLAGSEVIMKPNYVGTPSEINWKLNGNKLVDMELNSPAPPMFYRLRDRASIDRTNGELTIRDLTLGDFGLYRAEVLVNNLYQITEITLTVRACPDVPIIDNKTTEENIVLHCESSTPGVTYEWFNQTKSVGKDQLYSGPRPKKDVTLTCVVDNEVCKKNSSIIISYIPDDGGHGWIAVLIVILVLVLILVLIALLYHHREKPRVKRIYDFFTCHKKPWMVVVFERVHCVFCCCKGNKTANDEEKQNGAKKPENEQNMPLMAEGEEGDVEEGNAVHKNVEDSDSCGCISLNLSSTGPVQSVKLVKIGVPSIEAQLGELNGHLQRIQSLALIVERVKTEDYTAEALLSNGELRVFTIKGVKGDEKEENDVEKGSGAADSLDGEVKGVKGYKYVDVEEGNAAADSLDGEVEETDDVVIIRTLGDRVTLSVPDTEEVTRLAWKKGDVPQFDWTISGVKLHTNKIALEPGSVTIKNLEPGDSGSYEVEVHSTDDNITKNTFQLEVVKQVKTENRISVRLKVVRKVDPPENGHTESQPIKSITFHPIKMSNKTGITWKKEGQPVNTGVGGIELGQNGDLTINNVTLEDKGKYTVHCEDQEQEFDLCL